MENKHLLKIQKLLNNYFSYFKHDNILVISEDKAVLPFAYIIVDPGYKNTFLLSLAVDYPNSINVAQLILSVSKYYNLALSEPFFINPNDGITYFNDDAYKQWDLQSINLDKIEPASQELH
jgi:hypothetical protein